MSYGITGDQSKLVRSYLRLSEADRIPQAVVDRIAGVNRMMQPMQRRADMHVIALICADWKEALESGEPVADLTGCEKGWALEVKGETDADTDIVYFHKKPGGKHAHLVYVTDSPESDEYRQIEATDVRGVLVPSE